MIHYRPKLDSELWERKSQVPFENIAELKSFIADYETRHERYCWKADVNYGPQDVTTEESSHCDEWKNCRKLIVGGRVVGYCGEQGW